MSFRNFGISKIKLNMNVIWNSETGLNVVACTQKLRLVLHFSSDEQENDGIIHRMHKTPTTRFTVLITLPKFEKRKKKREKMIKLRLLL